MDIGNVCENKVATIQQRASNGEYADVSDEIGCLWVHDVHDPVDDVPMTT
jgi:hypothetical protein